MLHNSSFQVNNKYPKTVLFRWLIFEILNGKSKTANYSLDFIIFT